MVKYFLTLSDIIISLFNDDVSSEDHAVLNETWECS